MKTSNKMLLGLFVVVLLGIIAVNVVYKFKLDSKNKSNAIITNDSIKTNNDRIIKMDSTLN